MKLQLILVAFIVIVGSGLPVLSEEPEPPPDPILVTLGMQFEHQLQELKPPVRIEFPAGHAGTSLTLRYMTRKYMVYPSNMTGRLGRELTEREGPDDGGVLLEVTVQRKGAANQAVVPQTIKDPYWKTDLNVYPVENSTKQLCIALSYRGTDQDLISKLHKIAQQAATGQPATRPESKPEDKEKPKPESEERSR